MPTAGSVRDSYACVVADNLEFMFNDPGAKSASGRVRRASAPTRPVPRTAGPLASDIDWLTLREAHQRSSIPIATIRKWATRGKIRARLVRVEDKQMRLVAYGDVTDRAKSLDRPIQPLEHEEDDVVVDLRDRPSDAAPAAAPAPEAVVVPPEIPEGSILVPQDAWNRLLGQLGNIHEAGQQLAEARERAAKAETEAEFLKERVKDMRSRAERAELALELHEATQSIPEANLPAEEPVLQIGWRRFRDRWLNT